VRKLRRRGLQPLEALRIRFPSGDLRAALKPLGYAQLISIERMARHPQRSLKHEYQIYIEREIEIYKDSIQRSVLLAIADDAVRALETEEQLPITEVLLTEEVDRKIAQRLGLASYPVWRRRRLRLRDRYRHPESHGMRCDDLLVREVRPVADGHVLVAGVLEQGAVLYLAAHGSEVTALDVEEGVVDRIMAAASAAGLTELVRGCVADLGSWTPDVPLSAVICSVSVFDDLPDSRRGRAIEQLQRATLKGGVHLLRTRDGSGPSLTIEELRSRYAGWVISEQAADGGADLLARKQVA
jgi:hypothetical protein